MSETQQTTVKEHGTWFSIAWSIEFQTTVTSQSQFSQVFSNCFIILIGWGLTSGGGKQANVLQEAVMPIVSNARCKTKYPTVSKPTVYGT